MDDGRTSFSRHGAFGSLVTLPGRELVIMRSKKGNKRKSGKAKTRKFNTNTTVANNDSRMAMTTMTTTNFFFASSPIPSHSRKNTRISPTDVIIRLEQLSDTC